jgi:hypothetical protein
MKNRALITVLAVLLAVASCASAFVWLKQHKIKAVFARANEGMSQRDLEMKLGDPWRDSTCGAVFGGNIPSDCVRELIYRSPLAPAVPDYWAFRFDRGGKLVDKYHYASP